MSNNSVQLEIAIIFPCFNEEGVIFKTVQQVKEKLVEAKIQESFEYVFIDDGSSDNTLLELFSIGRELSVKTKVIQFTRNFGKESAIFAGLEYAKENNFDGAVFIDADGQDSPETLVEMLNEFLTGKYDDVYAKRVSRDDSSTIKSKLIEWYYHLLNKNSRFQIEENVGDFRVLSKTAIKELVELKERARYTKGMFAFIGMRKKEVLMDRHKRIGGKSKWNISKQIDFALDGFVNFTYLPYKLSVLVTVILAFMLVVYNFYLLFSTRIFNVITLGIDFLLFGVLLVSCVCVAGMKVLMTILEEVKNRSIYIKKE